MNPFVACVAEARVGRGRVSEPDQACVPHICTPKGFIVLRQTSEFDILQTCSIESSSWACIDVEE